MKNYKYIAIFWKGATPYCIDVMCWDKDGPTLVNG